MMLDMLLLRRRIPTMLEPQPLGRILPDHAFQDSRGLHRKIVQVFVRIAMILIVQWLAEPDFMLTVGQRASVASFSLPTSPNAIQSRLT